MTLVEFTAHWCGDYTKEEFETYAMIYGDDKSVWPKTNSTGPITIDIEKIVRINPSDDEGNTIVELYGSRAYAIVIDYNELIEYLKYFGITITTFKNAL